MVDWGVLWSAVGYGGAIWFGLSVLAYGYLDKFAERLFNA